MDIRNFCIIAHIDHGKSTLSDRLLEVTATVSQREMKHQLLDQMDLERERGITIKLQPVRMDYISGGKPYILNLIDTPGHVDFSYEVSRSLAAVEGAILLVDATQGIQAQTLANLYLAMAQNLTIIPALNKIDLPSARIEQVSEEVMNLLGCTREEICLVSGKTGQGVDILLEEIVKRIPPPPHSSQSAARGLIFDSVYDEYRGVLAYVRVFDGRFKAHEDIGFANTRATMELLETGHFKPKPVPAKDLSEGEIGYFVTGLRDVKQVKVGDTVTHANTMNVPALEGYKEVKPMVFAGIFCKEGDQFQRLRDAVEKLNLNDSAFTFEPEHSTALGFGFRCGFLGLLHLEIIQERLRREYNLDLIITVPSVAYKVATAKEIITIRSPQELPDQGSILYIEEPWMRVDVVTPDSTIGNVMSLVAEKRGVYKNTEYLSGEGSGTDRRVLLHFEMPLASVLVDFYDNLKSVTSGYASLNYEFLDYRKADVVRLDILVAEDIVEALSSIVYEDQAYHVGRKVVATLKDILPRQQFEIKLQAAIGSKIIASERITAFRKDVTSGLYGGDVSRKQKLLAKQKKGKKRMMSQGRVDIPPEAYLSVLKRG